MILTATKCVDGKRHNWDRISDQNQPGFHVYFMWCNMWCKKCGCRTEFSGVSHKSLRRCKDEDGTYYIEIPKCHRVWEEPNVKRSKERIVQEQGSRSLG